MNKFESNKAYERFRDETCLLEIGKGEISDFYQHFHFATELCCVNRGVFDYIINGKRLQAKAGDIIFVNPGEMHQYFAVPYSEVYMIVMNEMYSADFVHEYGNVLFDNLLNDYAVNRQVFQLIEEFFPQQEEALYLEKKVFADRLYAILCRNYVLRPVEKSSALLIKILEYINNNYKSQITLESVAEHFSYSKSMISKLFRQKVNVDFRAFVNNVRAAKVRQMLHDPVYREWNLLQMVTECGFAGISTFYRSYKRYFGELPVKK